MNEKQLQSDIKSVLKELKLPAILTSYQSISEQARKESLSYEAYLYNSCQRKNRAEKTKE